MDIPPLRQKGIALLADNLHGAAHFAPLHPLGSDQFGLAIFTNQVDLGLPVAEEMHVRWFVVIDKDDDAQAMRPENRYLATR